jgi:hypothetical protein
MSSEHTWPRLWRRGSRSVASSNVSCGDSICSDDDGKADEAERETRADIMSWEDKAVRIGRSLLEE